MAMEYRAITHSECAQYDSSCMKTGCAYKVQFVYRDTVIPVLSNWQSGEATFSANDDTTMKQVRAAAEAAIKTKLGL